MLSNDMPETNEHLASTRTLGAPFGDMCKLSIFNPNAIRDSGFGAGRHFAEPVGILRYPRRDELLLLHYKYLGFERTYRRHCALNEGLGPTDIGYDFGYQYRWSTEQLRQHWDGLLAQVVDVKDPAFNPWEIENLKPWWRSPALAGAERRVTTKTRVSRQRILSDLIIELEKEVKELSRIVKLQKKAVSQAEMQIASLLTSRSWQITTPLRLLSSALLAVARLKPFARGNDK
jgi:hypothetical protein